MCCSCRASVLSDGSFLCFQSRTARGTTSRVVPVLPFLRSGMSTPPTGGWQVTAGPAALSDGANGVSRCGMGTRPWSINGGGRSTTRRCAVADGGGQAIFGGHTPAPAPAKSSPATVCCPPPPHPPAPHLFAISSPGTLFTLNLDTHERQVVQVAVPRAITFAFGSSKALGSGFACGTSAIPSSPGEHWTLSEQHCLTDDSPPTAMTCQRRVRVAPHRRGKCQPRGRCLQIAISRSLTGVS